MERVVGRGRNRGAVIWLCSFALVGSLTLPTGSSAQNSKIELAGDVLQYAIPAAALVGTAAIHDSYGTLDFLKSFFTNMASTGALKFAISRERPDGSNNNSLPSGHTSSAVQGASFIHFHFGLKEAVPAYAGATFVAFSRVHSRKHHVSDVVAGGALGVLSSFLFTHRFQGLEVRPAVEGGRVGLSFQIKTGGGF